jgi:hypothetical protein
MNRRFASAASFAGAVIAATLAAAAMTGTAHAEGPILVEPPFVGTLSRDEVRADVLRGAATAHERASEWAMQSNAPMAVAGGQSRAQVRSDYIAARDEVSARTSEDSGSFAIGRGTQRMPSTQVAQRSMQ